MQHAKTIFMIVGWAALGTACHSAPPTERPIKLVPGAERIHLTSSAAELTKCKALGDVYPAYMETPRIEFRNNVAGLGGNAALVTAGTVKDPLQGVAYQCP